MLRTGLFIASVTLFLGGQSKVYGFYRRASCGETIRSAMGIILPRGEKCNIYLDPPRGKATTMDLFWDRAAITQQEICSSIQISLLNRGDQKPTCYGNEEGSFFFTGQATKYSIKLNNLEHNVYYHIDFVNPRNECNSRLNYETHGVPIEFTKNRTDAEKCILVVPPSSVIQIEHTAQSRKLNECIQLYVTQGPSLRRATVASYMHCVGENANKPVELLIFCHAALLHIRTSRAKVSVKITVVSPNASQVPMMIIKHAEYCPNYHNYNGYISINEPWISGLPEEPASVATVQIQ